MRKTLTLAALCFLLLGAQNDRQRPTARPQPVTRTEVDQVKRDLQSLMDRLAKLEADVAAIKDAISRLPGGARPAGNDEIVAAIKNRQIVLGLTLAQAQQIIGDKGERMTSERGFDVYRWQVGKAQRFVADAPANAEVLIGEFEDGKLAAIRFGRSGGSAVEVR